MRPPDKRESRPPDEAALPVSSVALNERENTARSRKSLYRDHPDCALLVKRAILRCGGAVRA
jgi:hypothetical protein